MARTLWVPFKTVYGSKCIIYWAVRHCCWSWLWRWQIVCRVSKVAWLLLWVEKRSSKSANHLWLSNCLIILIWILHKIMKGQSNVSSICFKNAPSNQKWLPSVCQAQLLQISQDMFPFGNWWMIPVPLIMTNKLLFVWWFTRQMSIMGMTNAPFKFKGCPAAHNGKEFVSLLCRLVHGYRTKANLLLQLVSLLTEYECRQAGLPMVLMENVCLGKQVPAYSRNKPYGDYCGTYHYQQQLCLLSEFWNLFCQVIFTEKHLVFNMV